MTNEELVLLIQHCDNRKEYLTELYTQNRNLIADIAKKYTGLFELDDLMQEGYIGLAEAAESYDPEVGAKFSSYAAGCIRYHLLNYLRDHGYIVRIPAHLLEKLQKLKRVNNNFYKVNAHEPTVFELASILRITPQQAIQLLSDSKLLKTKSINEVIYSEDDSIELQETIADPDDQYDDVLEEIQHEQLKEALWAIVDSLEPDQARVIHERYENNLTVAATAEKMQIIPSRVRSHEQKAMRELRRSRNTRKLQSFYSGNSQYYSLGLCGAGLATFNRTWTSAQERAVLLAEEHIL